MIKTTITGKAYIVNVLAAPLSLYAVLPDGSRELLRTITETGQHTFIAQSGTTLFEGGAYGLITGPFDPARVALGGGAGSTTATPGPKGDKGDPGEKGDKGDPGESPAAEDVALQLVPLLAEEVELTGPDAPTNTNTNYFSLGAAYLAPGVVLREFGYHVKTNAANGMCEQPVYMGIWELAEDGATWAKLGASVNTQVQVLNSDPLWAFELGAVKLSGRPLRFCLLAARDDAWRTDLLMGVRCVATEEADTYVYPSGNATAFVVKYTLRGYKTLTEKGEKGDPADPAQLADLQAAAATAQQAAAAAQQTANAALNNANLANDNLSKEKNEALQHLYWHHTGKHTALAALMGENGEAYFPEAGHVTQAEKDKWDGYKLYMDSTEDLAQGAARSIEEHSNDTTLHITEEERDKWNAAAENSAGFEDTGKITGGNATTSYSTATGNNAHATGLAATATGNNAHAGSNSTATGYNAQAISGDSTATGCGAQAAGYCSTATGYNARAKSHADMATGYQAQAEGGYSTATGSDAQATSNCSTATGCEAQATGIASTATGNRSKAKGYYSTATGSESQATEDDTTATGYAAEASDEGATATGAYSKASANDATAMGYGAKATGRGSFAIGAEAEAGEGEGVLRITSESGLLDFRLVCPGSQISQQYLDNEPGIMYYVTPTQNVYISLTQLAAAAANQTNTGGGGFEDTGKITGGKATGTFSTATGSSSTATGVKSTATGVYANASDTSSTATGFSAQATGSSSTATGCNAQATGPYSTATGCNSTAKSHCDTATGNNAQATGSLSTATGYNAQATGAQSTATGYYAQATGGYSTATGHNTQATGSSSTATGRNAQAEGDCSTATGVGTRAEGFYATATGYNAQAVNYSFAGGARSIAKGYATTCGNGAQAELNGTAIGRLAFTIGGGFALGANAINKNRGVGVMTVANGCQSLDDTYEPNTAQDAKGWVLQGNVTAVTQLYLIGAQTAMANKFSDGEPALGFIVWAKGKGVVRCGTRKLSELLTDNAGEFSEALGHISGASALMFTPDLTAEALPSIAPPRTTEQDNNDDKKEE